MSNDILATARRALELDALPRATNYVDGYRQADEWDAFARTALPELAREVIRLEARCWELEECLRRSNITLEKQDQRETEMGIKLREAEAELAKYRTKSQDDEFPGTVWRD